MLQKKVSHQTQISSYSNARRLPEKLPRVRAVQTRNNDSSNSCSTFRNYCKKSELESKSLQTNEQVAENIKKKHKRVAENIQQNTKLVI